MLTAGIVCLGFLLHVAQAIPTPGRGALEGYCLASWNCKADECCVSFIQPRGKRMFMTDLSPELEQLVNGRCVKRGVDTKGDYCVLNGAMPQLHDLFYHCPCASGYSCEGTGRMALPDGEIGTCNVTKKRATTVCSSGADCADDECCVSNIRPIGKRAAFGHGHCAPMGTSGSSCLVKLGSGKPAGAVYGCPCTSGLTCRGMGVYDVPLGEMGQCGAFKG